MTVAELKRILSECNRSLFGKLFKEPFDEEGFAAVIEEFNGGEPIRCLRYPCFCGTLRGLRALCSDFIEHITLHQPGPKPLKGRVAVGWVLDDDGKTSDDDLDVVVAVGINYGQGPRYLNQNHRVLLCDRTQMRPRLTVAAEAISLNCEGPCPTAPLPREGFHLVAFNFFPWITGQTWSNYNFNAIEEALLLHCCGWSDPLAHLADLLGKLGNAVTHLVFHGANNAVPLLGTAFVRQYPELLERRDQSIPSVQVILCDNLARPSLPVANAVGLCLSQTGDAPEGVMGMEE